MRKRTNILGVWIDRIGGREALDRVWQFSREARVHTIVTPNPEFLLLAKRDSLFRTILNDADLALPDGAGLTLASFFLGEPLPSRITGVDFFLELISRAAKHQTPVYLLGGGEGVAEKTKDALVRRFPELHIVGARSGGRITHDGDHNDLELLHDIQKTQPVFLFVAFGHGKQEKWIWKHKDALSSVRVAMGVGGTFDYVAGIVPRAPRWMRALGCEWLFRLLRQPSRLPRIVDATIRFPLALCAWRFSMMTTYRPNVVGCILDPRDRVLLIRRKKSQEEHWQLPQGGIDKGETSEQAVLREMKEEIGTDHFTILKVLPHFHKYTFPPGHPRYGYRGQEVTVFVLRFEGNDAEIQIDEREASDWEWFSKDEAVKKIYSARRPMFKRLLEEIKTIPL